MTDAPVEKFSDDVAACRKRDSPGDGKLALAFEDGVLGIALCTAKHQAGVLIVSKVKNRQAHEAGLKRCVVVGLCLLQPLSTTCSCTTLHTC